MVEKQEAEHLLDSKLNHQWYNADSLTHNAKQMKKYAKRALEEADEILSYTVTLDEILADQAEEMNMYDGDSK